MPIRMDLTGVEAGGDFEPIPNGAYPCTVFDVEQRTGKDSGQPYLSVQFKVQGGEYDGRRLWSNYSLQQQSLWAIKGLLITLGWSEEQLAGQFEFEPTELMGKACVVVATVGDYQGKATNNVDRVLPADAQTGPAAAAPAGTAGNSGW